MLFLLVYEIYMYHLVYQKFLIGSSTSKKRGHALTINAKFAKEKSKGKNVDIQFPHLFDKVCEEHAKYFKS